MDERRLEVRVGLLVFAALAGVGVLLWLMGELRLGSGELLTVDFSHTGNVVEGAPVKLAGVHVGRVEHIALFPERRDALGRPLPVRMELSIGTSARAALRQDARVTVNSVGPLGEPYLELTPGSAGAPALGQGVALRGVDALRLDLVTQQLSALLDATSRALEKDPQALENLIEGLSQLTVELATAAKELRELASFARAHFTQGGKGQRFLDDAAATAALLRQELPGMSANASKTLAGLANLTRDFTPEDGARLRQSVENSAEAVAALQRIAERSERLFIRLEAGQGSAGKFINDSQLYDDLKALVTDLRQHPWKVLWKD